MCGINILKKSSMIQEIFCNLSSGGHFVQQSETVCAAEDSMRNICVKLFGILKSGLKVIV